MTNTSKARGTAWETMIVNYLIEHGWPNTERRALHGSDDRGDIAGIVGLVVEAKNDKRFDLAGWLDEATAERDHDGADLGVAWFKRRGHPSPGEAYVLMDGAAFVLLLKAAGY